MGGDVLSVTHSLTEEESSLDQELDDDPHGLSDFFNQYASSAKLESGTDYIAFDDVGPEVFPSSVAFEAKKRRTEKIYAEVLRSYDQMLQNIEHLEEAKRKILSYTPGSWIEKVGGTELGDYDVPKTTSLLLIGPKGSGKSSLINKVSRALEADIFASDRAQVLYDPSVGDGTYFVQEYKIPRGSGAFCLYDTRSLSDESSENMKMVRRWMTKGVQHGELVLRNSDNMSMKSRMKYRARLRDCYSREVRMVNFVIFVVNGVSVLEAVDSNDETKKQYMEMIATTFRSPLLSFKDDRPVIVVTHGDLLSISDRVRVRVHLGELLGVPPHNQIFDIPESNDPAAELTTINMIRYCLEHADRSIPLKSRFSRRVLTSSAAIYFLILTLVIAVISAYVSSRAAMHPASPSPTPFVPNLNEHHAPPSHPSITDSDSSSDSYDWRKIRHLWLG